METQENCCNGKFCDNIFLDECQEMLNQNIIIENLLALAGVGVKCMKLGKSVLNE